MSANDKKQGKPFAERLQDVKDRIKDAADAFVEDLAELLAPAPEPALIPIPKTPHVPPRRRR